jgi:hypothetical protein
MAKVLDYSLDSMVALNPRDTIASTERIDDDIAILMDDCIAE